MQVELRNNIQWLDTLRALATLGVILVHVSSPLVNMTFGKQMDYWWIGNILNSLVRFSVPAFLMLSGFTLMGKDYQLGEFYKRRMMRVFLPFIFWLVVYAVFRWSLLSDALQPRTGTTILNWVISLFLKIGISKHLWYVYMIIFLYLIIPFISNWIRKLSNIQILLILLFWAVVCYLLMSVPANPYNWSGNYGNKFLWYTLHFGYIILGYFLGRFTFHNNWIVPSSLILFLACSTIAAVFTYYLSVNSHRLNLSYYGYFTANAFIQNTALFVLVKHITIKNSIFTKTQSILSNYSFGIYLVHVMVIDILFSYGIFWNMAHPLISVPVLAVLILFLSFIIIFLLRKVPLGKYVAG